MPTFPFLPIKRCKRLQWLTIGLYENKPLQNAFKRIYTTYILYSVLIILLLKNNLTSICSKISKIGMNLWMVYTCNIEWAIPFFIHTWVWTTKLLKTKRSGKNDYLTHKSPGIQSWQFSPSEKNDAWKKFSVSHPEKGICANLPLGKMYLETDNPGKNHNQANPWIFTSIPLCG